MGRGDGYVGSAGGEGAIAVWAGLGLWPFGFSFLRFHWGGGGAWLCRCLLPLSTRPTFFFFSPGRLWEGGGERQVHTLPPLLKIMVFQNREHFFSSTASTITPWCLWKEGQEWSMRACVSKQRVKNGNETLKLEQSRRGNGKDTDRQTDRQTGTD